MEKHKFNHDAENVFDATGIPKERIKALDERINELHTGEGTAKHSEVIEKLSTEFTALELAMYVSAAARREIKRQHREKMEKILGLIHSGPFGGHNPAAGLAAMFAMIDALGDCDDEDEEKPEERKSFKEKVEEMQDKERD